MSLGERVYYFKVLFKCDNYLVYLYEYMTIKSINLSFISLKQSSNLQIDSPSDMLKELFLSFQHKFYSDQYNYVTINAIQQNTEALEANINKLVAKYARDFPELNKIKSFLSLLPNDHYFIIINGRLEDTHAFLQYFSYLEKHHEKHGIRIERSIDSLNWGTLPQLYNINIYGHQRKRIGTWRKDLRVCRFCSGKSGEINYYNKKVTFNKDAHAFSHALGNNHVILNEECDACNERFGAHKGIEISLIALLKMFRAIHGLKGKNGTKIVDGENFTLWADGKSIEINYNGNILEELCLKEIELELILKDRFIPQNIYRCLCKFVLSVIHSDDIKFFTQTIKWINYGFHATKLPKIAFLQDASFFDPQPTLIFFQRKKEDSDIPFMVGEFHYADIIYVFPIPFCEKDKEDFIAQDDYELLWNKFNQIRSNRNWQYLDYSSIEELPIICNFTLAHEP